MKSQLNGATLRKLTNEYRDHLKLFPFLSREDATVAEEWALKLANLNAQINGNVPPALPVIGPVPPRKEKDGEKRQTKVEFTCDAGNARVAKQVLARAFELSHLPNARPVRHEDGTYDQVAFSVYYTTTTAADSVRKQFPELFGRQVHDASYDVPQVVTEEEEILLPVEDEEIEVVEEEIEDEDGEEIEQ
jgi:hypothetical protein